MEKIRAIKKIKIDSGNKKNNDKFLKKHNTSRLKNSDGKDKKNNKQIIKNTIQKEKAKNKKFKQNMQKMLKNNLFLSKIAQNWLNFLILFILFITVSILFSLVFSKSEYYDFLARPKVLQNPNVLISIVIFLGVSTFSFYFAGNIFTQKKDEVCATNLEKYIDKQDDSLYNKKVVDLNKKNFFKKLLCVFKSKKINFPLGFVLTYLLLLLIILFFILKNLLMCALLSFFVLMLVLNTFATSKKTWQKLFSLANVLVSVCIFLSFYFVYLLN